MLKLSIIMATYNAKDSVFQAINSIESTINKNDFELIVVDDCSKDNTYDIVLDLQKQYPNIKLFRMKKNSGSPSEPRNLGIINAVGEYITFVDDDDIINSENLMQMVETAIKEKVDYAKGYLINFDGKNKSISNKINVECKNNFDTLEKLIQYQSTTSDLIVKREYLINNNIKFDSSLKIGEDTVFVSSIFSHNPKALYIDNSFLQYNKIPSDISNLSSTQTCGDLEINSQISAWKTSQKLLSKISINYYKLRLPATLRNLMLSIVRYSNNISQETFNTLSSFIKETSVFTKTTMNLSERYKELYETILSSDYNKFLDCSKQRILINGYDLKFVLPIVPYLEKNFSVKIDEWTGHDIHDKKQSEELLKWADIIWCEWLLGNAVYYSNHVGKNQRLIIRAHRFELGRDFGFKVNFNKVNMFLTVGYYYYELFAKKFNIPREKMRLLNNYVEPNIYSKNKTENFRFNIGLVGILPARKGFLKGLELLKNLKQKNNNFKLIVMGKKPNEIDWIKNNPLENEYFNNCEKYIKDNNLKDSVIFGGFVEREHLYNNIGYSLSLSDSENPESFHLAPAEGVCSGSLGLLLNWSGVEYVYSKDFIFKNLDEISDVILNASKDQNYFNELYSKQQEYILSKFDITSFIETLNLYLKQIMILN